MTGKTRGSLRAFGKRRANKYNAVKTVVDGLTFDSKREAARYGELRLLERLGKIDHLCVHPKYALVINDYPIANYKADFSYTVVSLAAPRVVEDVKSKPTAARRDFILIRKLMKAIHGIDVEIVS